MSQSLAESMTLLSVAEAQERLLSHFLRLSAIDLPLAEAAGCILAEDILAGIDLPPFSNSAMDGFALRTIDLKGARRDAPARLRVVADIPAGETSQAKVEPGQAARIMTGAPMPVGADTVIPVEDTDFNFRQPGVAAPEVVAIYRSATLGENVRQAGEDIHRGDLALRAGIQIRPQDIGFLSMIGVVNVPVRRRPRVAILSAGDELLPVEAPLTPGKIHDANGYMLVALVKQFGGEPIYLGIVPDREDAVKACLDQAASEAVDLILSSAGVSVGAFDFVRSVVEQYGRLDFWRVNMRPGKPLAFGHYGNIPFIGLPGNPVSAFVGFEVFVRPTLNKMLGLVEAAPVQQAQVVEDIPSDGRESYLRAVVAHQAGQLVARLTGHQGSGNLHSLVQANALLVIPSGVKLLPAGSKADVWMLNETPAAMSAEDPLGENRKRQIG